MDDEEHRRASAFAELWKRALQIHEDNYVFRELAKKIGAHWATLGFPETDDPVNDLVYLLRIHPSASWKQDAELPPKVEGESFYDRFSIIAATVAPGWTGHQWSSIIHACLSSRYGPGTVRIKKNPASAKRIAAKKMNAKQLMKAYGISRSYAYKLLMEQKK